MRSQIKAQTPFRANLNPLPAKSAATHPEGPKVTLEVTAEAPSYVPEVTITKHDGWWCYLLGCHHPLVIDFDNGRAFPDSASWWDVAQFINSKVQGPVNVVVL